jgi:hypothetical protein
MLFYLAERKYIIFYFFEPIKAEGMDKTKDKMKIFSTLSQISCPIKPGLFHSSFLNWY